MPLIKCEVNLILTWSVNCAIIYTDIANQNPTFSITETQLYVPVVTLSSQDNAKLLLQLNSCFKRTFNWNKYLAKLELLGQNPNLNYLVEPSFEGVNRIFVLRSEDDIQRTRNKRYYLPKVEIKVYNDMIDGFFYQPIKNNKTYEHMTYEDIRKIATGQGDNYTAGCLLDYTYFKDY